MSDGPKPRVAALLGLVLLAVLAGTRLWQLELDPPDVVVPGYRGQAHFRDEAAKAHEARNKALFDEWQLSDVDEYGFWRVQSPAWVYGEWLWFEAVGVGVLQARLFVVIHGILAMSLLGWLVQVRHGWPAAFAAVGLLGFNWAYLVYSRLALMEGALLCWLLVATVGLDQIDRHARRPGRVAFGIVLAVVGLSIACLIKQTGLLLVPAFAIALPWLGLRAVGGEGSLLSRLRRPAGWGAALGVAVVLLVLAALFFNPEYQERLAFNAEHFTGADRHEGGVFERATALLARGLFSSRVQLMFLVFAPLMLWLSTAEAARTLGVTIQRWRARRAGRELGDGDQPLLGRPDALDCWMLAWLALALLANLASPHKAIRFQLVMLPAAAWVAGVLVGRLWQQPWRRAWVQTTVRALILAVAVLGVGRTTLRFATWLDQGQPTAARMGQQLEQLIGERTEARPVVVVGEFAAQAVFETDYWHFYVRPRQFNTSPEVIRALGITHLVLDRNDFVERQLRRSTPEILRQRRELGTVDYRGRQLVVYEIVTPTPRPQSLDRSLDRSLDGSLDQSLDRAAPTPAAADRPPTLRAQPRTPQ